MMGSPSMPFLRAPAQGPGVSRSDLVWVPRHSRCESGTRRDGGREARSSLGAHGTYIFYPNQNYRHMQLKRPCESGTLIDSKDKLFKLITNEVALSLSFHACSLLIDDNLFYIHRAFIL